MKRRIILGISGASGVIYGVRALQHMSGLPELEVHLVLSEGAATNLAVETAVRGEELAALADVAHRNDNLAASIASGSCLAEAMLVMPCSIRTLSGIANSHADNLLVRAADVMLKERRRLILGVRETPLHKGHLELMARATDHGAIILPPVPAFYHNPQGIEDLVDQTIGKCFDLLDIEHDLYRRWGSGAAR